MYKNQKRLQDSINKAKEVMQILVTERANTQELTPEYQELETSFKLLESHQSNLENQYNKLLRAIRSFEERF